MFENSTTECLFLGGTADEKRLPVENCREEYFLHSLAELINDPTALDDGDPRPEKIPVVEIYLPLQVKHDHGPETVFALNVLSDDAIRSNLFKHFGTEVLFTR